MSKSDSKPKKIKEQSAVALSYDDGRKETPKIIATGKGSVAEQILEIAFANNIKVREDADLVALLGAIDIDNEIPVEAFAAVAEILAYVYRATGETPLFSDAPVPTEAPR